jgi:phospholipase/carboxylesterase
MMRAARIGPLTMRVLDASSSAGSDAGGATRIGRSDGPAVLLCHGFAAPGDALVPLARSLDVGPSTRWFFPEGPIAVDRGRGEEGRAWWPVQPGLRQALLARGHADRLLEETPPGLAAARAALEEALDALERDHGVRHDRLILGGFSQGAMLITEVALGATVPFAGLAILSGTMLSAARWAAAAEVRGPSIHAVMSHGRGDPLLPFAHAEALRALLERCGAAIDWVPHDGEHEIPPLVGDRLGAFARRRLA